MTLNSEDITRYEEVQIQKIPSINENEAYTLGKNPTIFKKVQGKDPDNRLPIPLAKAAVEDMTGYAASTGNIYIEYLEVLDESEVDKEKRVEYTDINKDIYNYNQSNIETTELYTQGLTQGESYELFWVTDKLNLDHGILTPEFAMVDSKEIVTVFNKSIKPELSAAIRYWMDGEVKIADVYYPFESERWKKIETEDRRGNKTSIWIRNIEGDTTYPYEDVPLSIYKINRPSQPLFEAEKEMIDGHDNLLSKSLNEIDRFNALIALFPGKVDNNFIAKMNEMKIIDDLGEWDKWPEYLEKSLSNIDEFYNNLADRLERLYHKTIKVPDFSDESFAGNQSGVAIRYKLMGLEFKSAQIEAYFNKGLLQRQKLIDQVLNAGTKNWDEWENKVVSKRNLPVDDAGKAEIIQKLFGIVSRESLLRFAPNDIVENVEIELQRIEGEESLIDIEKVIK